MTDNYTKVKITVSIEVYLDLNCYPEGLSLQEAVATEVDTVGDEAFVMYLELCEKAYLVNVEEAVEDKGELSLLAERMSKEL